MGTPSPLSVKQTVSNVQRSFSENNHQEPFILFRVQFLVFFT